MCVEPELSPCVHLEKHTNSTNNTPIVIQKKYKMGLCLLSAEPPSQGASEETHFFYTTRATTRNLLAGFLAQPRPPGALVGVNPRISQSAADVEKLVRHSDPRVVACWCWYSRANLGAGGQLTREHSGESGVAPMGSWYLSLRSERPVEGCEVGTTRPSLDSERTLAIN